MSNQIFKTEIIRDYFDKYIIPNLLGKNTSDINDIKISRRMPIELKKLPKPAVS